MATTNKGKLKQAKNKRWEDLFAYHLRLSKLDKYLGQQVIIPESSMRRPFDFGDLQHKVLIEIQGGIWSKGKTAHAWGAGIMRDHVKINDAQFHGYVVFQFSDNPIKDLSAIDLVENYYKHRLKLIA